MKQLLYSLTLLLFLFVSLNAGNEARFMRFPDIHKDKIVFTYEGDLWLASTGGGVARRITNAPGIEVQREILTGWKMDCIHREL